jgi:hypothetical protein
MGAAPAAPAVLPSIPGPVNRPTLVVGWVLPPMRGRMEPILAVLHSLLDTFWFSEGVASSDSQLVPMDDATVLVLSWSCGQRRARNRCGRTVRSKWTEYAWIGGTLTSQYFVESMFGQVEGSRGGGGSRGRTSRSSRGLSSAPNAQD